MLDGFRGIEVLPSVADGVALGILLVDDAAGEGCLSHLGVVDVGLEGTAGYETVDEDWLCLAKAIGASDCLLFPGGVEAKVKDDDSVGALDVETLAAGSGGDEQHIQILSCILETIEQLGTLCHLHRAINATEAYLGSTEELAEVVQRGNTGREYQNFVATLL